MPDLPEVAIEGALLAEAQRFANSQSLTISNPNKAFTPPAAATTTGTAPNLTTVYGKWLRATVLKGETRALSISENGTNKHYGYLQIDVFYGLGKVGAGSIAPLRIAADAIAYFPRNTKLTRDGVTVEIIDKAYALDGRKDDPWWMVPVRIPYCAFV